MEIYDINSLCQDIISGKEFNFAIGDFLDEFYRSENEIKIKMLKEEAVNIKKLLPHQIALLGATAHKLSNDYQLPVPKWVWNKKYYMEHMWFPTKSKGKIRLYLLLYSPPEFKHRNLFVSENVLNRV